MIKSKDLNKEVRALDDSLATATTEVGLLKSVVKAITLLIKLVRDVRINQTTIMKAQGIKLVEPEEDAKPGGEKK